MAYPEVRRDETANVAYVAFTAIGAGDVAKSVPVEDEQGKVSLVVDFSSGGAVLGIEFLDAATRLPGTGPSATAG